MDRDNVRRVDAVVVYSPVAGQVIEVRVSLPQGATARDALHASGLAALHDGLGGSGDDWGVWGTPVRPEQVLVAGDRVELYRPLKVDPKSARRERFKKQGSRRAGLFSKQRVNAKAGY